MPHKPEISRTTLANMIEACLITVNKLEDALPKTNSRSTKELQCDYALWILNEGIEEEPIFIDEAGVNLHAKKHEVRSIFLSLVCFFYEYKCFLYSHDTSVCIYFTPGGAPTGQRAVPTVNGRRGLNFIICFAVSNWRGFFSIYTLKAE